MSLIFSNKEYNRSNCFKDTSELIKNLNAENSHDDFFIIVPTGKYAKQLKNNIIRLYWDKYKEPIGNLNIYTIEKLIFELLNLTGIQGKQYNISSAFGQALFEKVATETTLGFYSKNNRKMSQNLITRLFNIIYGLREDGISKENFINDIENPDTNKFNITHPERYKDIMDLFINYDKALSGKITDLPGLLNSLINRFDIIGDDSKEIPALKNKNIFVYGFSDFKEPEIQLFCALAGRNIPIAVHLDLSYRNGPLFNNLSEISTKLKNNGFIETILDHGDNHDDSLFPEALEINKPVPTYIRRWIFNTEKDIRNPNLSKSIKIFSCMSRMDEVNSAARLVKHLVKDQGFELSDICISFRNPGKYASIFRDVFSVHGIEYNVSDRFNLASSTVINAIFNVLDVLIGRFRRNDIIRCLQSPYLNFKDNPEEDAIDIANLNIVANKLRISGGNTAAAKYWIERLNSTIKFNENLIAKYSNLDIKDLQELEGYKSNLENYKKAKSDLERFIGKMPIDKGDFLPDELSNIIINSIIKGLGIEDNILQLYSKINQADSSYKSVQLKELEKDARALREFVDLLNEFVRNLKLLYPDKTYKFSEIVANLKTAVTASKFQIRERRRLGVDITSIEQTRGMSYKASILCGALDREFPMSYSPESFLGKELHDSEDRHLRRERQLFYQFLTNEPGLLDSGEKKIYIFYPQKDEKEDLVRSPFIDSLLKISSLENDGRIIDLSSSNIVDPEAKIISDDNAIFSIKDLQLNWFRLSDEKKIKLLESISQYIGVDKFGQYLDLNNDIFSLNRIHSQIDRNEFDKIYDEFLDKSFRKGISVTAIDEYASCPFKFFANRVLKFDSPEEEEEFLSPIEKGSLKHNILFRLYRTIQKEQMEKGTTITKFPAEGLPEFSVIELKPKDLLYLRKTMEEIVAEELERVKFDHPFFEIESRELIGTASQPGFINNWINAESQRFSDGWKSKPALFEFSFGLAFTETGKYIPPVEISNKIKLRGKVDRIEYYKSDSNDYFLITDYKNKALPKFNLNSIEKGKSFQMPLYAAAIRKILKDFYEIESLPGGFVYYLTVPGWDKDLPVYEVIPAMSDTIDHRDIKKPKSDDDIQNIIDKSIELADDLMDSIIEGTFTATPSNDACKYCNFAPICRKDDRI